MSQNIPQDVRIQMDAVAPAQSRISPSRSASVQQPTAGTPAVSMTSSQTLSTSPGDSQTVKAPSHGWTSDARKLVKLWAGQIAINRQKHQQAADSMSGKSTDMKITAAVFGSAATLISLLNTSFGSEPTAGIILNVFAGVFAAISTLVGVVLAILALDSESEKHRQTAIQYANVCNEAQTVLVEEHEENLPQATEFLRRMKDLTHLIQLFGPSLEEREDSDLPSIILLRGVRGNSGAIKQNINPVQDGMTDELAGIFDHDDRLDNSPQNRRKKRADMLKALKSDTEDIKRRQQELIAEENDLKALSKMISLQAGLTADQPASSNNIIPTGSKPASVSAPALTTTVTAPNPTTVTATTANSTPTATTPVGIKLSPQQIHHTAAEEPRVVRIQNDVQDDDYNYRTSQSEPPAASPHPDVRDQSDTEDDEEEWTSYTDSDDPVLESRDHISPVIRSSLRESMFGMNRPSLDQESIMSGSPSNLQDNIRSSEQYEDLHRLQQASVAADNTSPRDQIADMPTNSSGSRTHSGDGLADYDLDDNPHHSLTQIALNSVETVRGGIKKMQIAPDVLRAEIRRREDKIQAQKKELANKQRNNKQLKKKIESERRQNVSRVSPQKRSQHPQPPRRSTAPATTSVLNRRAPPIEESPRSSPRTNRPSETPRGVIDRLKEALSPQKSQPKPDTDVVEAAHNAQREKMQAIQDLCGDELSFECMREEN